ncbi:MAG: 4Fe-4S dicluster domain-containing protein [Kiritimatiellaeota bacterium]|nr:4Fe-4S dicluster domain-containing protein [Kiritimatiellota bacterium]
MNAVSRRNFLKGSVAIGALAGVAPAYASTGPENVLSTDRMGVLVDTTVCIGCRYCMVACPFQIPAFEYHKALQPRIMKCDFCFEQRKNGDLPACVQICPVKPAPAPAQRVSP